MGPEKFYEHFKLFGFGNRTGIDLGGEKQAVVNNEDCATTLREHAKLAVGGNEVDFTAICWAFRPLLALAICCQ